MKKTLVFISFCLSISAVAQDKYKLVAQETCDCMSKKDLSAATKKSIEMSLGLCMLEGIQKNNIEIEITDNAAMRAFGEKIGIQMVSVCPDIFAYLTQGGKEQETDTDEQFFTISGKIKSIDEGEFLFINIKDDNGKETRLIWLQYFKGSDDYITEPHKIVGKKVTIKYQPVEFYLPKAKGYYGYKQIVEMSVD